MIGCSIGLRKGLTMTGSLLPGKICTTVLFISVIAMVMFPGIPEKIIEMIAVIDSAFLIFAFSTYAFSFFSKKAKHKVFIDEANN